MSYKVTGAAAVVELDDGNPDLNTGTKVYLDEGGAVPPNAKPASVDHLVTCGLIGEVQDGPADEPKPAPRGGQKAAQS